MNFVGFVALEANLFAMLVAKNGDLPTNADALPTYRIYGPGGTLRKTGTSISHTTDQTGLYRITQAINAVDGFAAGETCFVLVQYAISAANKALMLSFVVS